MTNGVSDRLYYGTLGLTLTALGGALLLGLLPALLAGFLMYQIVTFGARVIERFGTGPITAKLLLLALMTALVTAGLGLCVNMFTSTLSGGSENLVVLLQRMADVVERSRGAMPPWAQQYLPSSMEEWQAKLSEWLRENARHLSAIGKDISIFLFHILAGMIIGSLVAFSPVGREGRGPLTESVCERVRLIGEAFSRIVFSQVRISALNTILTGVFLLIVLPLLGSPLPLTKTIIALTFIAGLLPIVGNLISNTVITLIALSVSPVAAAGSLLFLIALHKLEYFINARIIGSHIEARAWELLLAMLVMESAFGMAGLVAAPIYYAYLKSELSARKLI